MTIVHARVAHRVTAHEFVPPIDAEDWKSKPAKNRRKDKDARWTKKHERSYFGYKNHIGWREPWLLLSPLFCTNSVAITGATP